MAELRLFKDTDGQAIEVPGSGVALERHLQTYIERNMEDMLGGVRFLASEYRTGKQHAGRVDSLGLDEDGSPVVIEYKRGVGENVINQALYYLAWARDHRSEFETLVADRLGASARDEVDWSNPRVICVASDFSRYDRHAIQEMGRRIDLVRYLRFGEDLLSLELFASVSGAGGSSAIAARGTVDGQAGSVAKAKTIAEVLAESPASLVDLYKDLDARLVSLGDGHSVVLKHYIAYRRSTNFACVKVKPRDHALVVFLKVPPTSIDLVEGYTRDVTRIGHHGTGALEVRIRSAADLDRAAGLLQRSFEAA